MKQLTFILAALLLSACTNIKKQKFTEKGIRDGVDYTQEIKIDFITETGEIDSPYLNSIHCTKLNSISFPDNKLQNTTIDQTVTPYNLTNSDFKYGTASYYAIFTAYHFIKASEYYTTLMQEFVEPNIKEKDKNITISIADDMPIANNNSQFVYSTKDKISPSPIYHKVGHRYEAFLRKYTKAKYQKNKYISIGFMEYFTTSLNNSPLLFEGEVPPLMVRNVSIKLSYPINRECCNTYRSILYLKEAYSDIYKDEKSTMHRYINIVLRSKETLEQLLDTHSTGMYISYPLWRIRESIGAKKADHLIMHAWTMLADEAKKNTTFYQANNGENVDDTIDWYTVVHALLKADQIDNKGKNKELIRAIFTSINLPVERVQ